MILAAHQPQYLPWLGYLQKIAGADVFLILDDVQYKKNEWQNRNRIKSAEGWQWVTVPVTYRFPSGFGRWASTAAPPGDANTGRPSCPPTLGPLTSMR